MLFQWTWSKNAPSLKVSVAQIPCSWMVFYNCVTFQQSQPLQARCISWWKLIFWVLTLKLSNRDRVDVVSFQTMWDKSSSPVTGSSRLCPWRHSPHQRHRPLIWQLLTHRILWQRLKLKVEFPFRTHTHKTTKLNLTVLITANSTSCLRYKFFKFPIL